VDAVPAEADPPDMEAALCGARHADRQLVEGRQRSVLERDIGEMSELPDATHRRCVWPFGENDHVANHAKSTSSDDSLYASLLHTAY
jgi:hypothetical protein